jgi:diphthamide synthase (EF-2-diphthine--ammonia ligase)
MFQPLKGKVHTKEYLRNKEYRQQYKLYKEATQTNWINTLSSIHTCAIQGEYFTFILTPSFYDKTYQLTTFNKQMQPMSHTTYDTITELVKENPFFYINENKIIDYINKEEVA